ncbi:FAD binding domain protein [Biscogniauxia mediterranea]|nr:FAD binding domain protein [Biscogniauxia mediterranea]
MSSSSSKIRIIIAGGGIAGLALANMLEKFDIKYVLLETHKDIAPSVGASIGLLPNGLRILDQLGCYEPLRALAGDSLVTGHIRQADGKSISVIKDMTTLLEKRHGYQLLFVDRQWLLQILYDNLQNKKRVLLNKRIVRIDHVDGGVDVITKDGEKFSGTLVVGADGINSVVRSEMWRIGNKLQPGYFPLGEEDRVPCYYKCSSGIAQNVPNWEPRSYNIVLGKKMSQLVVSGPGNRVYWFLFVRLPEAKYGKDIPKYSKEDEVQFVKEHMNLPITEKVTFGQVFSKRLSSTLTPINEIAYKKWFFKKIITFGDAAHKPNPIGCQGANAAIESAAEFVNALMEKRDSRSSGLKNLSDSDIEEIFTQTQESRNEQARQMIAFARRLQWLTAYENPVASAFVFNISVPLSSDETNLGRIIASQLDPVTLKGLPIPRRSRALPAAIDLPARPVKKAKSRLVRVAYMGGMGALLWVGSKALRVPPLKATSGWGAVRAVNRVWFAHPGVDRLVNALVTIFSHPILGQDQAPRLQAVYFLSQLMSPILIYTIEGYRAGNRKTALSLPSVFLAGMQMLTIGRAAPVHALLTTFQNYDLPTGRYVRPEVVKVLIPGLTLAYAVPTILLMAPTTNTTAWQNIAAFWQITPPLFSLVTSVFSTGLRLWKRRGLTEKERERRDERARYEAYSTRDVPELQTVYTYAFATQATVHVATLAYSYFNPGLALSRVFLGLPNPLQANWNIPDTASRVAVFFKYDMVLAFSAIVASNLYTVWDMRRLGYIRTRDALKACAGVILGQVAVGTGATWAGLWYWREGVLASLGRY